MTNGVESYPLWDLLRSREEFGDSTLPLLTMRSDSSISVRDLSQGRSPSDDLSAYRVVKAGDLVVNKLSAKYGAYGVARDGGLVSPAYWVLRVDQSRVLPRYLHYLLHSTYWRAQIDRYSKNLPPNIHDLSWAEFRRFKVALPPLGDQRRAVDLLDRETSRIERLRVQLASTRNLMRERQFSRLGELFELADTAPSSVRVLPLRRVIDRWIDYRGATPVKAKSGVPLVTAKNIRDGKIDHALSPEYVSEELYSSWMRRGLPQPDDVLLTTEAPLGEVAMVENPRIALAQRVILLRVDPRLVTPQWLYWYLKSPQGEFELRRRSTGSTALGIKADRLRSVPIPVMDESKMAGRLAGAEEAYRDVLAFDKAVSRQLRLLQERQEGLITAAVTAQVDVATVREEAV